MYIPFSYFGNSCTGSGYGYTYWNNDPITADAVTWTALCNGQAQSANILPSSSLAIAATTNGVSGIAANTLRVDAIWNITGSLNNVVAKNYTISGSTGTSRTYFFYYGRYPNDTYGLRWQETGTSNNVDSYIVPFFGRSFGSQTVPGTLTDNGYVVGSNKVANDIFKNRLTTYRIDMSAGSGSIFRGIGPDGKYFSYGSSPSSSTVIQMISSTVPVPITGSVRNSIIAISSDNNISLIESRSCYYYGFVGSTGRTGSYLDCNNQSASVTCIGTNTLQYVCAKPNSLQFENAVGAVYNIDSVGYGSC
jgi:hypothetical protein